MAFQCVRQLLEPLARDEGVQDGPVYAQANALSIQPPALQPLLHCHLLQETTNVQCHLGRKTIGLLFTQSYLLKKRSMAQRKNTKKVAAARGCVEEVGRPRPGLDPLDRFCASRCCRRVRGKVRPCKDPQRLRAGPRLSRNGFVFVEYFVAKHRSVGATIAGAVTGNSASVTCKIKPPARAPQSGVKGLCPPGDGSWKPNYKEQ